MIWIALCSPNHGIFRPGIQLQLQLQGHFLGYCTVPYFITSPSHHHRVDIEESPKLGYRPGPAMSSHPPARLTKKQRKATAFRERGKKSKGTHEGTGHPRPRRGPSTRDNGESYYDDHGEDEEEDEEDANAVPTMEDQDQAMVEMAGDTDAGAKVHDADRDRKSAVGRAATQKKKDKDKKKRTRADDGDVRPATKKARVSRGSDDIPLSLAREGDGDGATMSALKEDGDGSDKEGKQQRYILFVGMSLPFIPPFLNHSASLTFMRSSKGISSTRRRAKLSRTISPSVVRSLPLLRILL
jgi:hypothetical protein